MLTGLLSWQSFSPSPSLLKPPPRWFCIHHHKRGGKNFQRIRKGRETKDLRGFRTCHIRMVPPAQTSGLSSAVILSELTTDSTRRRKHELGRKWGKGEVSWNQRGLFPFSSRSGLWAQRRLLTPLSGGCRLPGYPQGAGSTAWGVLLSVTLCALIFPFSEPLTPPLPFLWVFPPSAPYSRLPPLVLQYFPLRCAKPLVTCLDGHALAETPSKGEEQQRIFVCLLVLLAVFFLSKPFLPSSPPPSPQ